MLDCSINDFVVTPFQLRVNVCLFRLATQSSALEGLKLKAFVVETFKHKVRLNFHIISMRVFDYDKSLKAKHADAVPAVIYHFFESKF